MTRNYSKGGPMSKPGSERLETHPVYSHQLSDGTVIGAAYCYLLEDDPGGVQLTLSDEDGTKVAAVDPEEALRYADRVRDAANIAIAAREHGAAPDAVPAEWAGEGTL